MWRKVAVPILVPLVTAAAQIPVGSPSSGRSFAALEGTFRDTLGHPVAGGVLRIIGSTRFVRGDDSGFFHFDSIPAGHREFRATRLGFVTVGFAIEMPASYTVHADVRLRRESAGLAAGGRDSIAPPAERRASSPSNLDALRARCGTPGPAAIIAGIIRDESEVPIPYASISLEGRAETGTVGERTGCFAIHGPAGVALTLLVRRIGYHEHREIITPRPGSPSFVDVYLTPLATVVGGITVTAQRDRALEQTGFYDRLLDRKKGLGDGWYLTPEDIDRRNENKVTHLIEGFPSIKLHMARRGVLVPMAADGNCIMATYVDGARHYLAPAEANGSTSALTLDLRSARHMDSIFKDPNITGIDDIVDPGNVAAIEIYPRAVQAPPQYQTLNGACGIILIWTKR